MGLGFQWHGNNMATSINRELRYTITAFTTPFRALIPLCRTIRKLSNPYDRAWGVSNVLVITPLMVWVFFFFNPFCF